LETNTIHLGTFEYNINIKVAASKIFSRKLIKTQTLIILSL